MTLADIGNEKATAEAFLPGGWFRSGDVGCLDSEGFLYIKDRKKEIIIVKGENVSSGEVENALYRDARIHDCVAVSLPDETTGERVGSVSSMLAQADWRRAVVVLKPGKSATEHELIEVARRTLANHAVPVAILVQTEPLVRHGSRPRSLTGPDPQRQR